MMLRWISLVPPGIVAAKLRRYWIAHAPSRHIGGPNDVEVERVDADRLGAEQQRLLQRLAAVELEQRVLGRRLALQELGEPAVAHGHERLRVDVEPGHRVAVLRVLAERLAVRPFHLAQLHERADHALHVVRVGDPEHRPFVRERALRDRPPAVQRAHQVLLGHAHVGEEHLVEVAEVLVGELGERSPFDAGRRGVDDERADALVLRPRSGRCARSTGTSRRGARPTSTPSGR